MPIDYRPLQTRGFVVVRGFLSPEELEDHRLEFARQPPEEANTNYGISALSTHAVGRLLPRIREVSREVSSQTDLRVDTPTGGGYFATARGINFAWHQDHESFYSLQNHYDYLNFYVPIVKPVREKSNLSIVPFDVLQRECPRTFKRVVRNGAARFVRFGKRRLVFQDDTGSVHLMSKDLEQLAETPFLDAGDLLLMRGDMIHRTQDTDTERVALSFRVASSAALISRARLADGGWHKAQMMSRNAAAYQRMFQAFEVAHRDELPIRDLHDAMKTVTLVGTPAPAKFLRHLFGEKRRAHRLARFVPKMAASGLAARAATLLEQVNGRARG